MAAHDFADTCFGTPIWAFCRSFFQGNSLFMQILLGPRVTPVNKVHINQLSWLQFWSVGRRPRDFCGVENAPCFALPQIDETNVVWEIQRRMHTCQQWIHVPSGGRPDGASKGLSVNDSSIILRLSSMRYHHAVPSTSWEIMMARRVRMSF